MLSLYIERGNIIIKDVDKIQIEKIAEWFNGSEKEQYKYAMGIDKPIGYEELYEKYLEVLINAHEFFLSINVDGNFAGFIKGRVDFKDEGEIWIMAMLIDIKYQNKGIGKRIVELIIGEFKQKFGIKKFYACIVRDNEEGRAFWNKNKFHEIRLLKGYFTIDNKSHDLIIMHRQL